MTGLAERHTEKLAEFVTQTEYDAIPNDVVEKAKRIVLDFLGCAFCGCARTPGKIISQTVTEIGGLKEATVIGRGSRVPATLAALANGTFGSACGLYDEAYKPSIGHPAVGSIPAALAMAERMELEGREFLVSVILGYEVAARVGTAVGPTAMYKGWHPRGGVNYFGAAAAAGKALGLDRGEMAHALGLAGAQAGGLVETYIPWFSYCFLSGSAAHDGVLAALLAKKGFTGGNTVLEGKYGYVQAVSQEPNLAVLIKDLGKDYQIVKSFQKRWMTSAVIHPAVDAIIELRDKHGIRPEDVEEIIVKGGPLTGTVLNIPNPVSEIQATWSQQYCAAAALLDGKLTTGEFSEEKLNDPRIRDLMKRVSLVVDPELSKLVPEHFPASVTVRTKHGLYTETVITPKGDPASPLTDEDLELKFRELTGPLLSNQRIEDLMEMVLSMDSVSNIRDFASKLSLDGKI